MTFARAALPAALLVAACGHLDEVDVTRSATVVVPAGSAALPVNAFGTVDLPLDRRALEQDGIDPSDVDSARLVGMRLEVTQGTSLEAWLDSVALQLEAPGAPRTVVAQKSGIRALPAGTTVLDLDVTGVDLKPYMLADVATVTAEVSGIQPPAETTVKMTATVRVDVNVSGLLR